MTLTFSAISPIVRIVSSLTAARVFDPGGGRFERIQSNGSFLLKCKTPCSTDRKGAGRFERTRLDRVLSSLTGTHS